MKKYLLSTIITAFVISAMLVTQTYAQATKGVILNRGCATMKYKEMEEKLDPSIKEIRKKIEEEARIFIENQTINPIAQKGRAVITIPVVFHVVHNTATPAENVSDACIMAQLKVINDDYRKLNTDWTNVTQTGWNALVADCEIEFCLAVRDPGNNPTTGITRTSTTATDFPYAGNKVKFTAQGGKDVWDRNKYFNIWVCDLEDGILGYAQFPGGSAVTDGLVIDYKYMMSSQGCGTVPYDKGRTSTHELGHCFGLKHVWGDDEDCSESDDVSDTPDQEIEHYDCFPAGSFQTDACSGDDPGTMWMNYMDYTNDACMYMFTAGQKAVINATMNGVRASLKTSNGCTPLTDVEYLLASESVSIYPNPSSGDVVMKVNVTDLSSANVTVFNALGEAVLVKQVFDLSTNNEVKLDMHNKPEGMYFVKMETPEGAVTKKIVINK